MARSNTGSSSNEFTVLLDTAARKAAGAPLTCSVWFRPVSLAQTSNLTFLTESGGLYFGVLFDGGNAYGQGAAKVITDDGTNNPATSTTIASTTAWSHCCATRTGTGSMSVWLNGGGKTTQSGLTNPQTTLTNNFNIAVFNAGGGAFSSMNGDIAEVAWWDVSLTDSEVLSLSKGVSPLLIRPDKLWFYSPLRMGTGSAQNYVQSTQTSAIAQVGTMTLSTSHPPMLGFRGAGLPIDFTSGGGGGTTTPQSVSITATTTTTVLKSVGKAVAVTATSTSIFVKQAGKAIAATATSTTTFLKAVGKSIAATATSTTTIATPRRVVQAITVTATSTLSVLKSVGKIAAITSTTSTALTRAIGKAVAATATSTTAITKQVGKPVSITATTTTTTSALKVFLQTVAITATTSASMLRSVGKLILPIGTTTTTLGPKAISKGLAVVATTSTTATKQVAKAVALVATSTTAFVKAIGKALGIVSTTASTFGETYIPAGATTPQPISITATTSVTVSATFIQGQGDTHDGDGPDAWAARRWAEEAKRRKQLVQRPAKLERAAMRISTQPINTPVTPLVASTSVSTWTPEDDDMDLADILDLL